MKPSLLATPSLPATPSATLALNAPKKRRRAETIVDSSPIRIGKSIRNDMEAFGAWIKERHPHLAKKIDHATSVFTEEYIDFKQVKNMTLVDARATAIPLGVLRTIQGEISLYKQVLNRLPVRRRAPSLSPTRDPRIQTDSQVDNLEMDYYYNKPYSMKVSGQPFKSALDLHDEQGRRDDEQLSQDEDDGLSQQPMGQKEIDNDDYEDSNEDSE